jgi:hypothetical protein
MAMHVCLLAVLSNFLSWWDLMFSWLWVYGVLLCGMWHYAVSWKVMGSIPDKFVRLFSCPNPSSRTEALGSTQPLTHEYQESSWGVKGGRLAHKAGKHTAICEPIVTAYDHMIIWLATDLLKILLSPPSG